MTLINDGLIDEGEDRYPGVLALKIHIPDLRNQVYGTSHE